MLVSNASHSLWLREIKECPILDICEIQRFLLRTEKHL